MDLTIDDLLQRVRKKHGGRILLTMDTDGIIYVRRISLVIDHDLRRIYECDAHLSKGNILEQALKRALRRKQLR
jgi:hypothetical protein